MNTKFFAAACLLFSITFNSYSQHQTLEWYHSFSKGSKRPVALRIQSAVEKIRTSASAEARAIALKEMALIRISHRLEYDAAIQDLISAEKIEDSLNLQYEKIFS